MGTIPSGTILIFKYRILNLNWPGQDFNANKSTEQIIFSI